MQSLTAALEIRELTKTFESGTRALDNLSLSVGRGSIFGCIGLNGAGKTTTIRIVAGLTSKGRGTIHLFGELYEPREEALKSHLGFVLDEPLYFDWMSASEYLNFVATMYNLPVAIVGDRIDELLEFFDLAGKQDDPIETLSTGMKKKISIAAAIMHTPRLVLLDEPLEGIDAVAASSIKQCLRMMAERGTTIVITSHVLDTVERLCDEIAVIHRGRNLLQCKTSDIRNQAHSSLENQTYRSLEELFVDMVSEKALKKNLSWL